MIVHTFFANWYHLVPTICRGFLTNYKEDASHFIILYGNKNLDKQRYVSEFDHLGFSDYVFCQSSLALLKQIFKHRKDSFLFHTGKYIWFVGAILFGCRHINWVCWSSGAKISSSWKSKMMGPVKKFIYRHFNTIVTLMEPDRISIINNFNIAPHVIHTISYASGPLNCRLIALSEQLMLESNASSSSDCKPLVLLGNSPYCINSYIQLLNRLEKYKGRIRVQCMLHYSLVKDDRYERLVNLGKAIFGTDFRTNEEFYSDKEKYIRYMNKCDIYICGVETQTGLGAIDYCLKLGKKIYITGKNLDWIQNEYQSVVFPLSLINEDYSYEDFVRPLSGEEKQFNFNSATRRRASQIEKWHKYLRMIDNETCVL